MSEPKMTVNNASRFQAILLVVAGAFFTATGFLSPLWAEYVKHLGGNLKTAGIAVSIYSMSYGVLAFVLGFVEKRWRHEKLFLRGSYFLFGVFALGYLIVRTPAELYLLQFLLAFAGAMQSPVCDTLYGKALSKGSEEVGWGLYTLTFTFSVGLGALIGSHLAHHLGFDWVFGGMSAFGFIAFIISIIFLR